MTKITPTSDFVGRIYGVTSGSPTKNPFCVIVTRVTKTRVATRRLEIHEVSNPKGNGYFDHSNHGKAHIKKPLQEMGEAIYYTPYSYKTVNYIVRGNDVLFLIDEDIVWNTITPESTVWAKV